MRSNILEYITANVVHCTTHDVKVSFACRNFLSESLLINRFYVDNNNGESGIGYDMIIGRDLMVQIFLMAYFKRQVLQWDVTTVHMKDPSSLIG